MNGTDNTVKTTPRLVAISENLHVEAQECNKLANDILEVLARLGCERPPEKASEDSPDEGPPWSEFANAQISSQTAQGRLRLAREFLNTLI